MAGGGAPGSTPALGAAALLGEVFGGAASPLVLALVLLGVDRVAWQILQLFRRSLWWCSPHLEHAQPFLGFVAGSSGGATVFSAPQLRHFGVLVLVWWWPHVWQNHPFASDGC